MIALSHAATRTGIGFVMTVICLMASQNVYAQTTTGERAPRVRQPSPAERIRADNTKIIERESLLRELKNPPTKPPADPARALLYKQLSEDFTRIQTINRGLMLIVKLGGPLDYRQLFDKATEINKCASRLKNNLALPEFEEGQKKDALNRHKNQEVPGDEVVKAALTTLNERITSFAFNPYFKTPQIADIKHLTAARRDLEAVIQLSKDIRKSAETLSKTSTRP